MSTTAYEPLLRRSVLEVGPYVPGASAREVEARLGRTDLIRLNWNENLFGPLDGVLEETAHALGSAWAYPEGAHEELREAVAAWCGAQPAQVVPGHGIQALTLTLVSAFLDPGDAVIIPRPTYGLYAQACAVAGAEALRIDVSPSLGIDVEAVAGAAARTGAKLAWICDPNNPTGRRLDAAEWSAFLEALPEGCVAVVDEAYGDYIEPSERIGRLAAIDSGHPVIVLRTFSKIFGLAGLRLGYMLVHQSLASRINSVQEPFNVNCAALAAGTASLRRTDRLPERREQVSRARRRLAEPLLAAGLRVVDSEANFVLVDTASDDLQVAEALARDGLLVRAGSEFGLPGFVRVTTGEEELMETVGRRIAAAAAGVSRSSRPEPGGARRSS